MLPTTDPRAKATGKRAEIQELLGRSVQNKESPAECYVRHQDIERAWAGSDTIQTVLYPEKLTDAEVKIVGPR